MSIEIIGSSEYKKLLKEAGFKFCGNEVHYFHPQFVALLDNQCETIYLDYLDSFEEFPTSQGIYFCVRLTAFLGHSEVWYVGKAGNFRNRWKSHHKFEALKAIQDVAIFCLPLDGHSKDEISCAERIYIEMLKPVFNDTSKPEKHLRIAS
jgi:hypothetical protein